MKIDDNFEEHVKSSSKFNNAEDAKSATINKLVNLTCPLTSEKCELYKLTTT